MERILKMIEVCSSIKCVLTRKDHKTGTIYKSDCVITFNREKKEIHIEANGPDTNGVVTVTEDLITRGKIGVLSFLKYKVKNTYEVLHFLLRNQYNLKDLKKIAKSYVEKDKTIEMMFDDEKKVLVKFKNNGEIDFMSFNDGDMGLENIEFVNSVKSK
jgi:hypothetical protein